MDIENEVKKAQMGDRHAFVELVRIVENDLYGMACSILRNEEDSADALQETILKAYKSISNLREPEYFKTWMFRIIINESKKIAKKRSRSITVSEFPTEAFKTNEYEKIELHDAVERLDEPLRIIIILRYFYDLNIKEISNTLEISESLAKIRLYRARKILLRLLQSSEGKELRLHGRS
ncbi:RNA polymerase sigma factor [Paenibacillus peoriae]|uniref:RNA polymerase sigma factor n=1 Tax=Paenibacillus peoriae TaxID=59893 RepID=UPI00096F55CE|nr:sigma-70 family RNA polymerase sigma factor [Paenibacillus peoriae]OMF42904.1 RNA polymerase [Paenibacillus peoriae]